MISTADYPTIQAAIDASQPATSLGLRSLNSFLYSIYAALGFSGISQKGVFFVIDVPQEQIISSFRTGFGCWNETIFVIIGDELEEV